MESWVKSSYGFMWYFGLIHIFGLGSEGLRCESALLHENWKFKVHKLDLIVDFVVQHFHLCFEPLNKFIKGIYTCWDGLEGTKRARVSYGVFGARFWKIWSVETWFSSLNLISQENWLQSMMNLEMIQKWKLYPFKSNFQKIKWFVILIYVWKVMTILLKDSQYYHFLKSALKISTLAYITSFSIWILFYYFEILRARIEISFKVIFSKYDGVSNI